MKATKGDFAYAVLDGLIELGWAPELTAQLFTVALRAIECLDDDTWEGDE